MLRVIFILCLGISFFSLRGQTTSKSYSIKAFLPFWKGASCTLRINGEPVHTQTVQNDMYSFSGQTTDTRQGILEIKTKERVLAMPLFIEPGTIKIRDKGSKQLEAYGTETNDTYIQVVRKFDSLTLDRGVTNPPAVMALKKQLAETYIRDHSASLISLQLLYDYYYLPNAINDSAYGSLFRILSDDLKTTALGKKIGKEVAFSGNTALGVQSPILLLPDSAGTFMPLYKMGEYTFVHFWASWCVPCKKEFPQLQALYQRFNGQGFSMTGVSLDRNTTAWQRLATRLPWSQVIDVSSWNGEAVRKYGVKAIPMNFLLDKNGVVIAKNLTMEGLETKLRELLLTKTF